MARDRAIGQDNDTDTQVVSNVVTLTNESGEQVASLNSNEVRQGFTLVAVKVRREHSIEFIDDRHADMLLTCAEITADGGNVSAEKVQHLHKAIETATKGACRSAIAAWDAEVKKIAKQNNLQWNDAIAHVLSTLGRAEKMQRIAVSAATMLESLK